MPSSFLKLTTRPLLALAFPLFLTEPTGRAMQPWAQGDPTPEEQQAMEWLNASRQDPAGTLTRILNLAGSDPVIAGFMLAEDPIPASQFEQWVQTNEQHAQADSTAYPSSEAISSAPLVFYPLFQQQAVALGAMANPPAIDFPAQRPPPAYIYPVPIFGGALLGGPGNVSSGPNATGGTAQFGPFGGTYTEVSQASLYASYVTPREWMLTNLTASFPVGVWSPPPLFLLQGDSLPNLTLGHTRMIGIAVTPGQNGSRVLTTYKGSQEFFTQSDLPFGNTGTVFITGVAYQDNNSNGVYDPGEGISGVTITPDHGGWYAVTSTSGGYAIPVPANSGTYNLTASGGSLNGATATVTVGSDSAKVDWVLPAPAPILPPQVSVPAADGVNQLIGLSTRGLVQTGDTALVGGFVISGPPTAKKRLLIRGVGPSLQTTGFPADECIPGAAIQIYSGGNIIASNNGWLTASDGGAAAAQGAAQVGDFPLLNWVGGGGDSALVVTLSPGAYTVVVTPPPDLTAAFQTGYVGLVEIYDLSQTDGSRLVNISTRGLVGTGDQQMVVGCTVAGSGHDRLLMRGAGPALAQTFGLAGVLPDPVLTLFDSSGNQLAVDDDWSLSPQTDQIGELAAASGAFSFAPGSTDAALLELAPPGNYTAIVGAKPETNFTGIALVEIYETP